MTIVEFLESRIAEDEAMAREAIAPDRPGAHWEWAAPDDDGDPESPRWLRTVEEFPTTSGVGDLPGFPLGYECTAAPSAAMTHIARHDPARVLRECAAKRATIEQCADNLDCPGGWEYTDAPDLAWHVLVSLAAVYADHPDFDPAWSA